MALFHDLQALHAVHAVDSRILRARKEIAALDTGGELAAQYNAAKTETERLRAAAVKAQAEQHDSEMRLQSIETKTAQVQKTLFSGTVTGPRELETSRRKSRCSGGSAATPKRRSSWRWTPRRTRPKRRTTRRPPSMPSPSATGLCGIPTRSGTRALSAEIAVWETERAATAEPVPAALLTRYDGLRAKKGGIGAAVVEADGTCGACHTRLNTGLVDDAKAAAAVQVCEYCGRILIPASFTVHA
jgi:predicted  nucleic acid-binding Zn-ribbon protein